jgi:pyruvate/2-oxoglutarate dehydrogenase complex dihydrolipoamide acyltransferase (E2) component
VSSSPTEQETGSADSPSEQSGTEAGLVQIEMPQMGVSVAEGTIVEWLKQPGDWVEADETVAMVTTDKVDVEIPSPSTGRLERILVEPDETVPVGTPLAEIDPSGKPGEAHPQEHPEPTPEQREQEQREPAAPQAPAETAGREPAAGETDGEPDRSQFYSPVVRRIAEQHGIDLSQVEGTGIGGRVRKRDVLAQVEQGGAPAERPLHMESPYRPEEEAAPAEAEGPAEAEAPTEAGTAEEEAPALATGAAADGEAVAGRREPMSPMRRQIAEHMLASRRTSAHCTTIVEVDMGRVAARRAELKQRMARREVSLTYLAFVARATVEALERHPIVNASIDGEEIVYHDDVNLGIAVALEQGLIVPVIRKAQRLSLEGMAAAIADVAERARGGRLEPDDVHGGTFTITNPGQFGAVLATPIINQPQVAILDLEAIVKRPVVISENGTDAIAIRPMTYLCMSWDHRALDGAEAARFLADVEQLLEGWGAR